jgi:ElaB/YqjD/DUF883 family membrane-anchored ribosome-binding protein
LSSPAIFDHLTFKLFCEDSMDTGETTYEDPKQQLAEVPDTDAGAAQSILKRGGEAYEHAEKAVSEVYDKAAQAVVGTYEHGKSYSRKNPDKALFIALGLGVGIGFLFGAGSRHAPAGRFARPVVKALSGIASQLFR